MVLVILNLRFILMPHRKSLILFFNLFFFFYRTWKLHSCNILTVKLTAFCLVLKVSVIVNRITLYFIQLSILSYAISPNQHFWCILIMSRTLNIPEYLNLISANLRHILRIVFILIPLFSQNHQLKLNSHDFNMPQMLDRLKYTLMKY